MSPDEIRANLIAFKKEQQADVDQNRGKYQSPEEMMKTKKAKLKIRQHFQKFFRFFALKQNQRMFHKWRAYIQFCQNQEAEFEVAQMFTNQEKKYRKQLKNEKNK